MHVLTGNRDVPHQGYTSSVGMGCTPPGMGCASPGMGMCLNRNGDVPHREWGCASPGMHILTGNRDVPHRGYTSSVGMGMCLTLNARPHQEWECILPGMGMLSPVMHILARNAYFYGECT